MKKVWLLMILISLTGCYSGLTTHYEEINIDPVTGKIIGKTSFKNKAKAAFGAKIDEVASNFEWVWDEDASGSISFGDMAKGIDNTKQVEASNKWSDNITSMVKSGHAKEIATDTNDLEREKLRAEIEKLKMEKKHEPKPETGIPE